MKKPLISIIIPIKNSSLFLENCLKSISNQSYNNIETLIIDSNSIDSSIEIANKYNCKVYQYKGNVKDGKFDAPHKRNYGVKKANGAYVYYVDADMELPRKLIEEAVDLLINKNFSALIIPEDSFGEGLWAKAKKLERRCYWNDSSIEAARFFSKKIWDKLGGLDVSLGGGGDDWDLQSRLIKSGYEVGRTNSIVLHNEGNLSLIRLMKKRFMYGRDSIKYLLKNPKDSFISYFPIRLAYIKNINLFLKDPFISFLFIIMRFFEYLAGFTGILYSRFEKNEK